MPTGNIDSYFVGSNMRCELLPAPAVWESWAWTPEHNLRRRAEEGDRAQEPSGDPEADAGPGAL